MSIFLNDLPFLISLALLPLLISVSVFENRLSIPFHWWAGAMIMGLFATVFHALSVRPDMYANIFLFGALFLLLFRWKKVLRYFQQIKWSINSPHTVVVILLVLVLYGFLQINLYSPISGDVFAIWLNKTKGIYNGVEYSSLPVVEYPSLIPTFNAFLMKLTDGYQPNRGLYIGVSMYFFWILTLLDLYKSKIKFIDALALSIVAIIGFDESFYNGMQDKIVMMGAGLAAIMLIKHFRASKFEINSGKRFFLQIGAFFAGGLALVKSEGMVLGGIIVVLATIISMANSDFKIKLLIERYAFSVFVFALLLILWPTILYTGNVDITNIQGDSLTLSSLFDIPHNLERIPVLMEYFISYINSISEWFYTSLVLSVFGAWLVPELRKELVFLWGIAILSWIFIFVVYLSTRAPLIWHLDTAFARLMSQHIFIYVLSIIIVFQNFSQAWEPISE